jgi:hypothetical protein
VQDPSVGEYRDFTIGVMAQLEHDQDIYSDLLSCSANRISNYYYNSYRAIPVLTESGLEILKIVL